MYILCTVIYLSFSLQFYRTNVIVCLDACFTQKHNAQKSGCDPACSHPGTFFIPELEVNAWKSYINATRTKNDSTHLPKQSKTNQSSEEGDHLEEGMRVPKSVLDGCLASFTAADEARVKGSTQFFDVTMQMAILCHHN
ncbi:hypothetical protein GYMLUDRAFT_176945 [Collybiopsis luxurians FD-317 M1]|uniref:Uncharacterized protein n=1 Tax=Collybiopsis luxurians FD-317 M1 TaxID=944289 RepID=A0A0D0CI18_9AGAR|nr:hypothetical protein GYMLUDRAFT_176945 [Collybiopsis luxurians FD-317 M1]